MQNESLQDDEIHHSVGKVNFDPCPRESITQLSQILTDVPLSPPPRLPAYAPHHKVLGKLINMLQHFSLFHANEYNNLNISHILIISNTMKNQGQIFNINSMTDFHLNNYYNGGKDSEEKGEAEDAIDSVDTSHAEAEEMQSEASCEQPIDLLSEQNQEELLSFESYIAEKETAHILMLWLHIMMDPISSKKPKEKLIYLRAVLEAKIITHKLPYKVYVREFGNISSNSYYVWMHRELKYNREDIDVISEQYLNFLNQYPK